MQAMKVLAVLATASLCAAAPYLAAAQTKAPPKAVEVLFVQTAPAITFKDGQLTLKNVSPTTVFFTDRPKRTAGHVRNDLFLSSWAQGKNSFKADPPNASLSFFSGAGARPAVAIGTLSNPRADGKDLRYDVRLIEGSIPPQAGAATLFIDGSDAPCTGPADPTLSNYPCWAQDAFGPSGRGY